MNCIGIEIGGTKLQVVAGSAITGIVHRQRFNVDRDAGADGIRTLLKHNLPDFIADVRPRSMGVGFGGPVDRRNGRVARSHQIAGWSGFALRDWIAGLSGIQVVVENDANTAALGEALCGAGKGLNPVFYITLGSGVGGGLVVNGRIYHGAVPGEAEIGHLRLDSSGTILEHECSGWAVDRRIHKAVSSDSVGKLSQLVKLSPGNEARHLATALAEGDELAHKILDEVSKQIAFGLSHVVHLFHPEIIVVGGGLSLIGDPLRLAIASNLPQFVMDVFHPVPQIALSGLSEDAVPIGALLLAEAALEASV